MREQDYVVGAYLASRQLELGEYIRKVYEAKLINAQYVKGLNMTPQEEKYKSFFNQYSLQVKDLSDIDLEAFIEEMKEICFGGKAALDAASQEKRERKQKNKASSGFIQSLEVDNIATDAINKIRNRQQKLSKLERAVEGMVKSGIPRADAERLVSARNVRDEAPSKTPAHVSVNGDGYTPQIMTPKPVTVDWTFDDPFKK